MTPSTRACMQRAGQSLQELAAQPAAFGAHRSALGVDAVRYGLDPFPSYLSRAESALAQGASELRNARRR